MPPLTLLLPLRALTFRHLSSAFTFSTDLWVRRCWFSGFARPVVVSVAVSALLALLHASVSFVCVSSSITY